LIDPLISFGGRPDEENLFDCLTHVELLRHNQQTSTGRAADEVGEVLGIVSRSWETRILASAAENASTT
jgi:hypothetical protein